MILLRVVGLVFAAIEIALALRLLLPFVEVPKAFARYVPDLVHVTDALMLPFASFIKPFDLDDVLGDLSEVAEKGLGEYAASVDVAIVVAMLGWAVVATFVLFVMRLVIRPGA